VDQGKKRALKKRKGKKKEATGKQKEELRAFRGK